MAVIPDLLLRSVGIVHFDLEESHQYRRQREISAALGGGFAYKHFPRFEQAAFMWGRDVAQMVGVDEERK